MIDINEINNIVITGLETVNNELIKLDINKEQHKQTEYWYLVLKNVEQYLIYLKNENDNKERNREKYNDYIKWFIKEWPPRYNKKGRLMYPKAWNPPEILDF
jgi:hypothetical protein